MQRTLIATVAAAALLTLAGTAQAQTDDLNSYAEVGYSKVTIKVDDIGLKTAPAVLSSVLGYWINPNLAVEAHLGLAMGSDDITDLAPHEKIGRGLAFVPQTENIFASLTILENLQLALDILPKAQRPRRLEAMFGMFPDLASRPRLRAGCGVAAAAAAVALPLRPPPLCCPCPCAAPLPLP